MKDVVDKLISRQLRPLQFNQFVQLISSLLGYLLEKFNILLCNFDPWLLFVNNESLLSVLHFKALFFHPSILYAWESYER